jgi:ATP-dependent DNA ligase
MPKFEFCLPTNASIVPDGADWLHEVKYDGYRLRIERDRDRVRLITRGGYDLLAAVWIRAKMAEG